MQSFGTNEYGNKSGFTLKCSKCGKEADIVPVHHYEDGDYKNPVKIVLELRCSCGNKLGATINEKNR